MRSLSASIARHAAVAAMVFGALGAAAAPASPQPLRTWRDGPVRVLLDADEYERFGGLKTDDERRAFIEQFWRELDANPGASGAEFRRTFEERCSIANVRFQTIREEGWKTDRGKVFLVLGEPAAIRHESGGMNAIDKEVWTFGAPGDPTASFEVAFYRCSDGSYRTDPSCFVARDPRSVAFDWERNNYLRTLRDNNPGLSLGRVRQLLNELLAALPRSVRSAEATPSTAPGPAEVPTQEADADPAAVRLLEIVPYYFRAQDGSVLALLTLEAREDVAGPVGSSPQADFLAAASLEERGPRGEHLSDPAVRTVALDQAAASRGVLAFFGRAYLESGRTYVARYGLKDSARGEIVVKQSVLTVPDLGSGFAASSLVPAERFGPAGSEPGRFQVGSEEVVPKVDASFRRSELLRLYLQVYGAATDPSRLSPRVDVVFRFQRLVNGVPKRFRKPFSVRETAGAAMGLALPIGDWPPGAYRVTVDLHDRVGGERESVAGAFTIVED